MNSRRWVISFKRRPLHALVKNLSWTGGSQVQKKNIFPLTEKEKKSKAIPITGSGGPWICEMLKILHCQEKLLRDGGKVVRPTNRPIAVAARSKARTVFARSNTGIVCSNPT
jgi:hypothetical protein